MDVSRRSVMKSVGSLASFGAFASLSSASPLRQSDNEHEFIGKTHFVEVAITHDNVPGYPVSHTDDFAEYLVDPSTNKVMTTSAMDRETVENFADGNEIVSAQGYHSFSEHLFGNKSPELRIDSTRTLELENEYESPEIRIEPASGGTVETFVEGTSVTVNSGTSGAVHLDPRTVRVRREGTEFKEVPDPKQGGSML